MANQYLSKVFPELEEIEDEELRGKVQDLYEYAMEKGGWKDLREIPFTLLAETDLDYTAHVRAVTRMAIAVGRIMKEAGFEIDMDKLIAGALLHDVGKLLEYEKRGERVVKSVQGRHLRHPISGVAMAYRFGLPDTVLNIIGCHSKEGEHGWRSNEAIIVHHCDFAYFETVMSATGAKV